jgi:Fe-coproporphyrin III synthase
VSLTGRHSVFQIHPTRRCNLACRHCYSQSGPDVTETLDASTVLGAVTDAAALGYNVLGVSGGEPLLYDALPDVLDRAKALGMTTTVTSNAMLLTDAWVKRLAGRVDVLAVSLDGTPEAHVEMRNHPNAFTAMKRNVARLRDSGIGFGFITTLTQHNVDQLAWVADFAVAQGASLLQVHPLEIEGNATRLLADSAPDEIEMLYATVETVRLRSLGELHVQLDINARSDLQTHPERYFVNPATPSSVIGSGTLGSWLSPLVLETSGHILPLTYGFDRRYSLGRIGPESLADLARRWDSGTFLALAAEVWHALVADESPALCNWYEAMAAASRQQVAA